MPTRSTEKVIRNNLYGMIPYLESATMSEIDWLNCSANVVVDGIERNNSGQLTRLYYESYGNPADDPGEHDRGPETRRRIDLRAVASVPPVDQEARTIIFRDDDSDGRYFLVPSKRFYPDRPNVGSSTTLATERDGQLEPIGVNVALAVPNDSRMSPQL